MSNEINMSIRSRCVFIPPMKTVPDVDLVIFNNPYTIINWKDGSKTIVKCMEGDAFDEHVGFQAAVTKKVFGDHGTYKRLIEGAQRQNVV